MIFSELQFLIGIQKNQLGATSYESLSSLG
jgi:hypothetical protein